MKKEKFIVKTSDTVAVTLENKLEDSVGITTTLIRELFPLEVRFDK